MTTRNIFKATLWIPAACAVILLLPSGCKPSPDATKSPDSIPPASTAKPEPTGPEDFPSVQETLRTGRALKVASSQKGLLFDGLQELLVEAGGQGDLLLSVGQEGSVASREFEVSGSGGLFGVTFTGKAGLEIIEVKSSGTVDVRSVSLAPAGSHQQALYQQQLREIEQFGFFNTSYQRPEPGFTRPDPLAPDPALVRMREVVVLDDPLSTEMDRVKNSSRLRDWLAQNGALKLDTAGLMAWMEERITKDDAYGTSVLFSYGSHPLEIAGQTTREALWYRYLRAGGRIVNIGDLPFYTAHSTMLTGNPQPMVSAGLVAPLDLMRLPYGWNQPLWGKSLPTEITPLGLAWGVENPGNSTNGFPLDRVTMALSTYKAAHGMRGAAVWFKNFKASLPWSGYVQLASQYDGMDDSQLRDVWRGLHFVGFPLPIPPQPPREAEPAPKKATVIATASDGGRRNAFAPGEKITLHAGTGARFYLTGPQIEEEREVPGVWDSTGFAPGSYQIADNPEMRDATGFTLAAIPPADFGYQIWVELPKNRALAKAIAAQLAEWKMGAYLANPTLENLDTLLAAGVPSSLRIIPELKPAGREITWEKTPEFYRLSIDRKPIPYAFDGGRPTPGITHPEVRKTMGESMRKMLRPLKNHPGFMGLVITNDDFSTKTGWDFSPHMTSLFKEQTGHEAPAARPAKPLPGIVPDDDPWREWFLFSYLEGNGKITHFQQEALESERPGTPMMVIPGGMCIPLVVPFNASQYPPLNFGKHGPSVIGSYYYNGYWQPQATVAYWMEAGRMGNRGLDVWTMPDCYISGGVAYVRNNLFHSLAAGVDGLVYFRYEERREPQWRELKHLSPVIRAIGPVQKLLQPSDRRVALLLSVTTLCYDDQHAIQLAYAYHNLSQAGYSVDIVSEEEMAAGLASQYRAVVLSGVQWLSRSAADGLEAFAGKGGKVLRDTSVRLDLPGSTALGVDLNANRATYGDAAKIQAIRAAMAKSVEPNMVANPPDVTISTFQAGGTPCAWFVNIQTGEEYRHCVSRAVASSGGKAGTLEGMRELWAWEEEATRKGPFRSTVRLPGRSPEVAYDLVGQRRLTWDKDGLHLEMERFGGSLVAFVEAPIDSIAISSPKPPVRGREVLIEASLKVAGGATLDATLPVRFELFGPDGKPWFGNRFVASVNGIARLSWTPALNDPAGTWTLRVTQTAAGVEAITSMELAGPQQPEIPTAP